MRELLGLVYVKDTKLETYSWDIFSLDLVRPTPSPTTNAIRIIVIITHEMISFHLQSFGVDT